MPNGTGTVLVPSPMPVDFPPPIKVPGGRERVFVNPPVIHIGHGHSQLRDIQFTNHTGGTVRLWFPNGALLFTAPPDGYPNFENPFVIERNQKLDLKLKSGCEYSSYYYHVYCDVIGNEAEGNSPPVLNCP